MEKKGFVSRKRSEDDERVVFVCLTDEGRALRDRLLHIPEQMGRCVCLSREEAGQLYMLLGKLLNGLSQDER